MFLISSWCTEGTAVFALCCLIHGNSRKGGSLQPIKRVRHRASSGPSKTLPSLNNYSISCSSPNTIDASTPRMKPDQRSVAQKWCTSNKILKQTSESFLQSLKSASFTWSSSGVGLKTLVLAGPGLILLWNLLTSESGHEGWVMGERSESGREKMDEDSVHCLAVEAAWRWWMGLWSVAMVTAAFWQAGLEPSRTWIILQRHQKINIGDADQSPSSQQEGGGWRFSLHDGATIKKKMLLWFQLLGKSSFSLWGTK